MNRKAPADTRLINNGGVYFDPWRAERELLAELSKAGRAQHYVQSFLRVRAFDFYGEPITPAFLERYRAMVSEVAPEALAP